MPYAPADRPPVPRRAVLAAVAAAAAFLAFALAGFAGYVAGQLAQAPGPAGQYPAEPRFLPLEVPGPGASSASR